MIRLHGSMKRQDHPSLSRDEVHALVYNILDDGQRNDFEEMLELDFSFDMALFDLYSSGLIDPHQALSNADSVNNLHLKIKVNDTLDTAGEGFKPQDQRRFERLYPGLLCRSTSATARSAGVVILKLPASPETMRTRCPICSTRAASSVAGTPCC